MARSSFGYAPLLNMPISDRNIRIMQYILRCSSYCSLFSRGLCVQIFMMYALRKRHRHAIHALSGLLLAMLFLPPGAFATNGYFAHGTGIKNRALAGAGVALPQDALASATNPAGMAFVGDRFDIGAVLFFADRGFSASESELKGTSGSFSIGAHSTDHTDWFLIPSFGVNKMVSETLALGFSVYGNGGTNTDYEADRGTAFFGEHAVDDANARRGVYGAGTLGVDLSQVFFNFSLARKLTEKISLGVSPIISVQGFRSRGLDAFAPFTKTYVESGGMRMPEHLSANGQDYSWGIGGQFGIYARDLLPRLDIGASYRTKTYMEPFHRYSDLFAEDGDFDIPASLWAGLAFHLTETLTAVFDYQRIWYEDVDSVGNKFEGVFDCPAAGGADVESCLGGDRGFGFGWRNVDVYKFGAQWAAIPNLKLRAGYSYTRQPIRGDDVFLSILAPGTARHHLTTGLTYTTASNSELSFEFMHAFHDTVEGQNLLDPSQTISLKLDEIEFGFGFAKHF